MHDDPSTEQESTLHAVVQRIERSQCYVRIGEYPVARAMLLTTLQDAEHALGPTHPVLARILNQFADVELVLGNLAAVAPLMERALAIELLVYGTLHVVTATNFLRLGTWYQLQGATARAAPLISSAYAIRVHLLGADHPATRTCAHMVQIMQLALADPPVPGWYRMLELPQPFHPS